MSLLQGIHHAAYRCRDAKQTIEFYREALGMDLMLAISEDRVPSTKEPNPYMHIFLDAGAGNVLAFFEIPNSPPMGRDENTLLATRERLKSLGIEVLGPTNHEMFQSIYFVDPNGHRIELAADTVEPGVLEKLHELAGPMVEEWSRTRSTVRHAAFLHEKEFSAGQ